MSLSESELASESPEVDEPPSDPAVESVPTGKTAVEVGVSTNISGLATAGDVLLPEKRVNVGKTDQTGSLRVAPG